MLSRRRVADERKRAKVLRGDETSKPQKDDELKVVKKRGPKPKVFDPGIS